MTPLAASDSPAQAASIKTHPTQKKLANRVFAMLFLLSLGVAVLATVAATAASFSSYEDEATQFLLGQATECAESLNPDDGEDAMCAALKAASLGDTRCTLVSPDGTVLFDNQANIDQLENHAQRAEIASARESGKSVVSRHSDTFDTDTLYAAVLIDDGYVLRLAETRTSLASFLSKTLPQLGIYLIVVFLVSFGLSRLLTRMVVRPLREIDLSHPLDNKAYAELQPLLERVDDQRKTLEEQNRKLEIAANLRREFTGNVSHEMKTPLQVIGGYAELIEQGAVAPGDVPRFAGLISEEAKAMRSLVDDVLTLSWLDEGASGKEPVPLALLSEQVAHRLEPAAEEKNVTLVLDLDDKATVLGMLTLVEQMIYNLTDNAIKHSPEGGTVSLLVATDGDTVTIRVNDEGPGVPVEYRERIFERFFRVDSSRSRETGGTGLGLAIVKHVVQSCNGTVKVEDAPGGGASFIVTLPAAQ